jgi:hypothetical protein
MNAREFFTNTFETGFLFPDELETIIIAMELYAYGKCKEQRELCSHALTTDIPKGPTHNLVLYAPCPVEIQNVQECDATKIN